jgi:hypothetical protein
MKLEDFVVWIFVTIFLGAVGMIIWWALPNSWVRPGYEADVKTYQEIALSASGGGERACPAIKMDVARALNDDKITVGEAAAIEDKIDQYGEQYRVAKAKSDTQEAAGLKSAIQAPNCPLDA